MIGSIKNRSNSSRRWSRRRVNVTDQVRSNLVKRCGDSNHGNRLITNGGDLYFDKTVFVISQECISYSVCWPPWLWHPASFCSTPRLSRCVLVREMIIMMIIVMMMLMRKIMFIPVMTVEEKRGNSGSYGRQILYKTLAQVVMVVVVFIGGGDVVNGDGGQG